jgi:hypothetical protein
VILVIKGSRTKVDESNLGVKQHPTELCRAGICVGRRRDVAVICEGLVVVLHEENVLGFEIGVDEIEIMQDCKHESETDGQGLGAVGDKLTGDARKELASELLDVSARKGHKSVALEEVKDALAQEIGDDADVVAHARVDKTRNSMRLASRYFCTERMILMATSAFLLRSYACTTLPNVPWPRSFTIESVEKESVPLGTCQDSVDLHRSVKSAWSWTM